MNLNLPYPYPPMEAAAVSALPAGHQWQYEPKWDGFRCLAFRDHDEIKLQSKAGKPLTRYFPEIVAALRSLGAQRFVMDGELLVPHGKALSFDSLLQRIHPAESRVRKLAEETPAQLVVFDLLLDERNQPLTDKPLDERRARLEKFAQQYFKGAIKLSPATRTVETAHSWAKKAGNTLDGLIAKRSDKPYSSGSREYVEKVKFIKTADCVVGGFRFGSKGRQVGSLLLGLYDKGLLHHVGFMSGIKKQDKAQLTKNLKDLIEPPGFTGNRPGGPSRWNRGQEAREWEPLKPVLVVEVEYDHFTDGRFRHGTRLIRWRPDKDPQQCQMSQVRRESSISPLAL